MNVLKEIVHDKKSYELYRKWEHNNPGIDVKEYGAVVSKTKVIYVANSVLGCLRREGVCMDLERARVLEELTRKKRAGELPLVNAEGYYMVEPPLVRQLDVVLVLWADVDGRVEHILNRILSRYVLKGVVVLFDNVKTKKVAEELPYDVIRVYVDPKQTNAPNFSVSDCGIDIGGDAKLFTLKRGFEIKDERFLEDFNGGACSTEDIYRQWWWRHGNHIALISGGKRNVRDSARVGLERVAGSLEEWALDIVRIRREKRRGTVASINKQIYRAYYLSL